MNNLTKTIIYVVLVIAALFFGIKFYSSYKAGKARAETELSSTDKLTSTESIPSQPEQAPANTTNATADTNAVAAGTNAPVTAETTATNAPATDTNAVAQSTNAPTATNQAAAPAAETATSAPTPKPSSGQGSMMAYLGLFLATVIILGLFVAKDVSNLLGQEAIDFLFNDDLKGVYDPEYEQALNAVHQGEYLAAIQMLREFLQKHPSAQYAALEIAEIYEKKLNNQLAAALEYEEILKKKLPAERWGWAAIHLCNLYSKLGKTDKTVALLRRIADEYGETAAAKKARKRLAMYESGGDMDMLGADVPEGMEPVPQATLKPEPAAPAVAQKPAITVKVRGKAPGKKEEEEPSSSLPPGFRPKK